MGLRKKPESIAPAPRRSLVASAAVLSDARTGMAAYRARAGEDSWQKTAWAYYDSIGELNAAVKWVANAVSLADLFAAETDPETGLLGEATDNTTVQAVVAQILGGPVRRAQAQATIMVNWQVAGEVFLVIRSEPSGDRWFVLSSTEVNEKGGVFSYTDPQTGAKTEVRPRDLIVRLWNPHARLQTHADSSVRSAAPILAEVERATMNIAARLDSRLAGAGILWVPEEADFPVTDQEAEEDEDSLIGILQRAAAASLRDPGQASAQVPITIPLRSDLIPSVTHQSFATELSQEIIDLRDNAIKRLAMALDIPPEIMTGMADTNHWSAWQIEESTYKIHVAPLLERIADALTSTYLQPTLARMGVANAERYVLTFSTQDIIARPDRFQELTELHRDSVISDDYYRSELGIPDDAAPSGEDRERQLAQQLITQAPSLVQTVPQLLTIAGISIDDLPELVQQEAVGQTTGEDETEQRALPSRSSEPDQGLTAAAELMVWDALSRAGGRLLTREHRGQYGSKPKHELHTVIDGAARVPELLEGSFQLVAPTADAFGIEASELEQRLRDYCATRILSGRAHDRRELASWLNR